MFCSIMHVCNIMYTLNSTTVTTKYDNTCWPRQAAHVVGVINTWIPFQKAWYQGVSTNIYYIHIILMNCKGWLTVKGGLARDVRI